MRESGGNFRILTLLDEDSRRCLAVHVGRSIRAVGDGEISITKVGPTVHWATKRPMNMQVDRRCLANPQFPGCRSLVSSGETAEHKELKRLAP